MLEILSIKIFLLNFILKIGQEKYLFINFVLRTNLWTYKVKDLNGKKNNRKFLWEIIVVEYIINQ